MLTPVSTEMTEVSTSAFKLLHSTDLYTGFPFRFSERGEGNGPPLRGEGGGMAHYAIMTINFDKY